MNEIAIRDEQPEIEQSALVKWATDARQVAVIAESIAKTSFVPRVFSGKANEVTAAILAGAEVGLGPMASLRAINVIQGSPALSALAMRGVAQSQGHDVWVEEASDTKAVVAGRRNGSDHTQRVEWTIQRAQKLGLTSKDNWKTQPQAMLIARATAECCRLVAADALIGMAYAVEELGDQIEPKAVRKTAQRKALTATPEPELAPPAPQPEPEPTVDADVIEADPDDWPDAAIPGGAA